MMVLDPLIVRNPNMSAYPEIHFVDENGKILYVYFLSEKKEIPGDLIPCPHCDSKFVAPFALLAHLERDHKDKKTI